MPVPFPSSYPLLLLALPGIWLLARALAHRITRDHTLRAVLPIGLALALSVIAIHLASLATGAVRYGLPIALVALAVAGLLAERDRRRRPDPEPATGGPPSPWMWITALAGAAFLAPAAYGYWFHDELFVGGHMSLAAQMQNLVYPPRHLQFPEHPMRYHYGFDLLASSITALLRLPIDTAIDTTALLLWIATWCLLWALGERLIGRRRAWLTPVMTLFASGLPVGCPHPGPSIIPNVISECPVGRWSVNPPVISYFFQHAWSLGLPIAVTAILVLTERASRRPRLRVALLAFLLAALSLGQITLFATVAPSLLAAEIWYEERPEPKRLLPAAIVAVAVAAGAKLLGGFLVSAPGLAPIRFIQHWGFADTPALSLSWNAMTFGAMWITGLVGFLVLRRARVLFGLLALGSIVVVNSLRYAGGTSDIVKFAAVGEIALGVMGSAAVARILPASLPRAKARTALAALLFVSATAAGFLFPTVFALHLSEIPGSYLVKPDPLGPGDVEAATFVRERARAGEMVYRGPGSAYAQWAGLPLPWLHWTTRKVWGFPVDRIDARERLLKQKPADLAQWRAQGFRFFVLDEKAKDDAALVSATSAWIAAGKARIAARFAQLRVVEILP